VLPLPEQLPDDHPMSQRSLCARADFVTRSVSTPEERIDMLIDVVLFPTPELLALLEERAIIRDTSAATRTVNRASARR
jgi:hypothetical protein